MATATSDWLLEYAAGGTRRVDRAANVIRDVKIHGLRSENGRDYLPEALKRAMPLYEGARVNVNHPDRKNLDSYRGVGDRIGRIRNVRYVEGSGLHGDFHYNPRHHLIEQVLWDAEHSPDSLGFSPIVKARTSTRSGRTVVEEIGSVRSVDLVADPATTRGLFEASEPDIETVTLAQLKVRWPDIVAAVLSEQRRPVPVRYPERMSAKEFAKALRR